MSPAPPASSRIGLLARCVDCCLLGDELFASSCSTWPRHRLSCAKSCSPGAVASGKQQCQCQGRPDTSGQQATAAPINKQSAGSRGRGWGQAAGPSSMVALPERPLAGSVRGHGAVPPGPGPLSLSRPGARRSLGSERIRRVLSRSTQPAAGGSQESPRSRPLSPPRASAGSPQAAGLERTTANRHRSASADSRLAQKFRQLAQTA